MRNMSKLEIPALLLAKQNEWTKEFIKDYGEGKKYSASRYRYREPEIKEKLKEETSEKCIYCESKIGHNTPGDVEHIEPTTKKLELHYKWENLTIACTECNRRKNDYYETADDFLNPYKHDVERRIVAAGPVLFWVPGDKTAEITIKTLELNSEKRKDLILRKTEKLKEIQERVERYVHEENAVLKEILRRDLIESADVTSEYSFEVLQYLLQIGIIKIA